MLTHLFLRSFLLGVVCLLVGSTIYILFRPTTLLMFHWAESVGLTVSIGIMRTWTDGFDRYLPTWVVYSLPFALWVSSYLFFITSIWRGSTPSEYYMWFWCIPVIAIVVEFAQSIHIIPGFFDIGDLIALLLATIFGVFVTYLNQRNQLDEKDTL